MGSGCYNGAMVGLPRLHVASLVFVLGASSCESSEPNLDSVRARFDHPTATLDVEVANQAADFALGHPNTAKALVCGGFLFELIQKFVDAVAPDQGSGADGGTSGDGGSSEGVEINGTVVRFSGDVRIDAACPGPDGIIGTADDGHLKASGTVRHAVLDPVWRASFRECYYPTECSSVAADGKFVLDLGQAVRPGDTVSLDNLVATYQGSVAAASESPIVGTLQVRKRADGVDVLLTKASGATAVLSLIEGGIVQLTTADGTYTCDFPARRCTNSADSRVFSW